MRYFTLLLGASIALVVSETAIAQTPSRDGAVQLQTNRRTIDDDYGLFFEEDESEVLFPETQYERPFFNEDRNSVAIDERLNVVVGDPLAPQPEYRIDDTQDGAGLDPNTEVRVLYELQE